MAEEFFTQRGFDLRIRLFGMRPALLVVEKCSPIPPGCLAPTSTPRLRRSNRCSPPRARPAPIIFSTVIYQNADLKDAGIWMLKHKGIVTLKAGSDGVERDPPPGFPRGRCAAGEKVRLVLLWHRPGAAAARPSASIR